MKKLFLMVGFAFGFASAAHSADLNFSLSTGYVKGFGRVNISQSGDSNFPISVYRDFNQCTFDSTGKIAGCTELGAMPNSCNLQSKDGIVFRFHCKNDLVLNLALKREAGSEAKLLVFDNNNEVVNVLSLKQAVDILDVHITR